MKTLALALCAATVLAGGAAAQTSPHQGHANMPQGGISGMRMSPEMMAMHGGPAGPETHQAMMRMHQAMMAVNERDPGRAWAAMMIPHHQGALDTARITLRHTQDRELRRIAEETIRSQGREITRLRAWLQRHGGAANR